MKNWKPKGGFFCFSPPVMIATIILELGFLAYVIFRYKMSAATRLVAAVLFFLAVFQVAEYFVCGGIGGSNATWSKIGFVSITLLPPLGIHLLHVIAGKRWSALHGAAYGMAAAWIVVFILSERIFAGHVCAGNYVIFQIKPVIAYLYTAYYYLWLFVGTYLCIKFAEVIKNKKTKKALTLFGFGYLTLLVPTTLANLVNPTTIDGIPSIMCGFAIILAAILTFGVLPLVAKSRTVSK